MAERATRAAAGGGAGGATRPEAIRSPRSSGEDEPIPSSTSRSGTSSAPRSPSMQMRIPSPHVGHRHSSSFSDSLRGIPPSPRSSRHPSVSSIPGVQDLLNNPPKPDSVNPQFAGRDWHGIAVGELVDSSEVHFVEVDTGIEDATNLLIESGSAVLLIRATPSDKAAVATYDYKDLNQYLLFATGSLRPDADHLSFYQDLAKKAQAGKKIPLREAKSLGSKEPFVMLPHTAKLTKVVEAFGGGVHRLIVVKEWTNEVIGILSQSTLVKFLWENGRSFPVIDQLYPHTMKDLNIGSQQNLISINGDRPLREALLFLDTEGVSSLAVLDGAQNVVGNISTADVRLLTKASSAPLLDASCMHFISVILSSRGLADGKDPTPVFHVAPHSTLAHVVAKLVATRAHRMWVTAPPSPGPSAPSTPGPAVVGPLGFGSSSLGASGPGGYLGGSGHLGGSGYLGAGGSAAGGGGVSIATNSTQLGNAVPYAGASSPPPPPPQHQQGLTALSISPSAHHREALRGDGPVGRPGSPAHYAQSPPSPSFASSFPSLGAAPSVGTAAMPGAHMSGRLAGVVSLTDVLNLFAKASGLNPGDLDDVRRGRRSSSVSSFRSAGGSSGVGL